VTDYSTRRSRPLDEDSRRWRVISARFVLLIGAGAELLLIAALPFDAWKSAERWSLLLLASLMVCSLVIAASLNRFPRASVGALGVLTLLSVSQLIRIAHIAGISRRTTIEHNSPAFLASFVVGSLAYYSFPVALCVVWPIWKTE
jgi:hypothetical protein